MGMPFMTLMPVFAAHVHRSGADTLGIMFGAVGLGGLIGALFVAQRKNIIGLGRLRILAGRIGSGRLGSGQSPDRWQT
jgi:hypothetical protein